MNDRDTLIIEKSERNADITRINCRERLRTSMEVSNNAIKENVQLHSNRVRLKRGDGEKLKILRTSVFLDVTSPRLLQL